MDKKQWRNVGHHDTAHVHSLTMDDELESDDFDNEDVEDEYSDNVLVDENELYSGTLVCRRQQQMSQASSSYEQEQSGRRASSLWSRVKSGLRWLFAFVFSNVGIIVVVVVYLLMGAFCFQSLEQSTELKRFPMAAHRNRTVQKLWQVTARLNTIFPSRWSEETRGIVSAFQEEVVRQVGDGYDGSDRAKEKWTFSGALLYCITVIAAIGYGHITPSTMAGKLLTMAYALLGMPLFLLYLSNIGSLLAKSFKFLYTRCLLCHRRRGRQQPLPPWIQRSEMVTDKEEEVEVEQGNGLMMLDFDDHDNKNVVVDMESESIDEVAVEDVEEEAGVHSDLMLDTLMEEGTTTVPIVLCLAVMISYILGGAFLFAELEGWGYLDGSYFCFITLSTIGFGDIVPGNSIVEVINENRPRLSKGSVADPVLQLLNVQFVMVTVYILLGMAVIAMCFNLMQEKVVHAVLSAGRLLGLVKDGQ